MDWQQFDRSQPWLMFLVFENTPGSREGRYVDLRLRVNGVRGVDGSVRPRVPRGNTTLPIIMVAERAAELIREDHGR